MKKLLTAIFSLCLAMSMAAPSFAYDYTIPEPGDPEYADDTSVEVVHTADGGAAKNENVSKNAAYIPPAFGSPGAYTPNYAAYLTPNLAPNAKAAAGAAIGGASVAPPSVNSTAIPQPTTTGAVTVSGTRPYVAEKHTAVTSDLYYSGGYLATLKIPAIGVNVKVYQGTDNATLAKGAGHFEETSIWDGNCCIAGHNRGANCYFGRIHELSLGDRVTLTTKLGTRTYAVTNVAKVSETDRTGLAASVENNTNVKDALLFNVLSFLSDKLLTEGNTVAALDELYIWLSSRMTIEYIRNTLKRVRKKESSLIMASQNLEDFDVDGIRELTRPLFAIPTHQFIFHCGAVDKAFYMNNLQLEKSEYELIRYPQNGVCLYKCGVERFLLEVRAPAYKAALFGSAGGR